MELLHRRMLAAEQDVEYSFTEHLLALLTAAFGEAPESSPADARLVALAREAIAVDEPAAAGLMPLADKLEVSPYRLSRAFTRELGVSLSR